MSGNRLGQAPQAGRLRYRLERLTADGAADTSVSGEADDYLVALPLEAGPVVLVRGSPARGRAWEMLCCLVASVMAAVLKRGGSPDEFWQDLREGVEQAARRPPISF